MKHILLLEDDAVLGQGIRLALENQGVQVELCATLSRARKLLAGGTFDLLIRSAYSGCEPAGWERA